MSNKIKAKFTHYRVNIRHNPDTCLDVLEFEFKTPKGKLAVTMDKSNALMFSNEILKNVIVLQFDAEAKRQTELEQK